MVAGADGTSGQQLPARHEIEAFKAAVVLALAARRNGSELHRTILRAATFGGRAFAPLSRRGGRRVGLRQLPYEAYTGPPFWGAQTRGAEVAEGRQSAHSDKAGLRFEWRRIRALSAYEIRPTWGAVGRLALASVKSGRQPGRHYAPLSVARARAAALRASRASSSEGQAQGMSDREPTGTGSPAAKTRASGMDFDPGLMRGAAEPIDMNPDPLTRRAAMEPTIRAQAKLSDALDDYFYRQSRVPPAGTTGFDPRLSPLWPGVKLPG